MQHLQRRLPEISDEQILITQLFYHGSSDKGDCHDSYNSTIEERVQGTCESFLKDSKFTSWQRQTSGILLVTAGPSGGKSVLAKYLAHEVLLEQGAVCYTSFQTGAGQFSIEQALCTIIYQLFLQVPHLVRHAAEDVEQYRKHLAHQDWKLWEILEAAVCDPKAGQVIMVVDAVDNCEASKCIKFLERLESLSGRSRQDGNPNECKCLLTGQPFHWIADRFEDEHVLQLEPTSEEIAMVIRHRVQALDEKGVLDLPRDVKEYLVEQLLAKNSQRNYLWAHHMMKLLEELARDTAFWDSQGGTTKEAIDKALAELPDSLNDAYEQILAKIYSKLESSRIVVRKVLSIVLAAQRPLNTAEMRVAARVKRVSSETKAEELDEMHSDREEAFKSTLGRLTGFLIEVHEDKVSFIHPTCREFLLQNPGSISAAAAARVSSPPFKWKNSIFLREAHGILAMQCVLYIDLFNSQPAHDSLPFVNSGVFLEYAAKYWPSHYTEAVSGGHEPSPLLKACASEICDVHSRAYAIWEDWYSKNQLTPLLHASQNGYAEVMRLLIDNGASIDEQDEPLGQTSLLLASQGGHVAAIQLLVALGAKLTISDRRDQTAKNVKDLDGDTSLLLAATRGELEVVKRLVDGRNIDSKITWGSMALSLAAGNGRNSVVEFLLAEFKKHADTESIDAMVKTPLLLAAANGHAAVVGLLLVHSKSSINSRDSSGNTPLARAAKDGHCPVVRLLLERNDVLLESRNDHGMTPLALAAHYDHETVVDLLLKRGADLETRNDNKETPLLSALAKEALERVRMLLDKGADPYSGVSNLLAAIQDCQDDAVRVLLKGAAKLNPSKPLPPDAGSQALHDAVGSGSLQIVAQLLDHGVPVDVRDRLGYTPLIRAAIGGKRDIAWFLIIRGANVNATDIEGQTAATFAEQLKQGGVKEVLNMNHSADQFRNRFKRVGDYYEVQYWVN